MKSRAKVITLRNLSPELAQAVRRRAERDRTSVNRAVIDLLEQIMGRPAKAPPKRF
jgi:hypothetical protein